MSDGREKTPEECDREHENVIERLRKKFLKQAGYIHYHYALEDNPRLQVLNEVLQERAKKKVN